MIRKGTLVRLKRRWKDRRPVKVLLRYDDIVGGVRLSEPRAGFVSWNVLDLERVRPDDHAK